MARSKSVEIDLKDFIQSAKKLMGEEYPRAVARAFGAISCKGKVAVQQRTRMEYNLHTDYIPKGVKNMPGTSSQLKAAARSIQKYHDIEAAVYLRGSTSPARSLDFMVNHEDGGVKRPQSGLLAVPGDDIQNYSFKTTRGKTKKAYKPATLLKEFNETGPNRKGHKMRKKGKRGKGTPFIMTTKSGNKAIVRRLTPKSRPLEFLYFFKKDAQIKETYQFEDTVVATTTKIYKNTINRYLSKMRGYKK